MASSSSSSLIDKLVQAAPSSVAAHIATTANNVNGNGNNNSKQRSSIPIHCTIERVVGGQSSSRAGSSSGDSPSPSGVPLSPDVPDRQQQHTTSTGESGITTTTIEYENYAIVASNLLYIDVVRTILDGLGYAPSEVANATATLQVNNWRPLLLDQLTDDKQATVGEILGEISASVTLRIKVFGEPITKLQPGPVPTRGNSTSNSNYEIGNECDRNNKSPLNNEIIIGNQDQVNGSSNSSNEKHRANPEIGSPEQQGPFVHPAGYSSLLSSRTPSVSSVNSLSSLTSLVRTDSNAGALVNHRGRKHDKVPFLVVFKVSGANAITLWPQGCQSEALPSTPFNENHLKVRRRRKEFMSSSICSSTSASDDDERDYQWDIMGSLKSLSSPARVYYKFRLANSADLPPGTIVSSNTNLSSENGGNGGGSSGTDQSASSSRQASRSPTPTPMKNNLIKVFTLRQPPKDQSGRCEFKPQESRGKYYNPNDFAMFMSEPLKHVRDATFAVDLTLEQNGDLEDVGTAHLYLNPQCSSQGTQRAPIIKSGVQVGELVVDFMIVMNPVAYNTNTVMPEWLTKRQPIHAGHRGLGSGLVRSMNTKPGDYLENTIASFNHAAQNHKFDSIELDVFLTLDGIPTIYHDFDVNLVADNGDIERHQVNDFTLEELRKLKLLSLAEKLNSPLELPQLDAANKPFPTLEEVFQNVHPSTGIYVEIKWPQMLEDGTYKARKYRELNDFIDKILEVVFKNANARRIILQSFEPDIVLMMRLKQTQFPVMMLSKGSTDLHGSFLDTRSISVKNGTYYAEAIGIAGIVLVADYYLDLGEDLVKFINDHNLLAHSWGPIECEENLNYLKRIGVQGFIYDNFRDPKTGSMDPSVKMGDHQPVEAPQNAQHKTWFFNSSQ